MIRDERSERTIPPAATGVGSMPGTSVAEAVAVVAGELPDLPHLPELPARGAGADLVGRTGALLAAVSADLSLVTVPTGWARRGGPSADMRRAASWLGEDLDRVEEVLGSSTGFVKVQLCGPWTWCAAVEAPSGQPLLRDAGFLPELADAWAAAAAAHVADVRRRLPGRRVVLQVDEPSVPAVLAGEIATASGFGTVPAVGAAEAAQILRRCVSAVAAATVLHCCARFPFEVAAESGFAGVSWDSAPGPGPGPAEALAPQTCDAIAAAAEAGTTLIVGVVPTGADPDVEACWRRLQELWRRTGLAAAQLADVAVSPACGLAGATPRQARRALSVAAEISRRAKD